MPYHEQHLANCRYNERVTYQQQGENNENTGKNQKHNIIWFNPPLSKSLKMNSRKYLFRLLNKHFTPGHKCRKIFNKNILMLSYSYMPNLKAKIDGHIKKYSKTNCLEKQNYANV